MGLIRESVSILTCILALSFSHYSQTVASQSQPDSSSFCTTDKPVYVGMNRKPLWFDTESLVRTATHCAAPQRPGMLDRSSVNGYVGVDILVDDKGRVSCARIVSGHPLLFGSALDAVKKWTFRAQKQDGKAVWFHGHLLFHVVDRKTQPNESPCIVSRW